MLTAIIYHRLINLFFLFKFLKKIIKQNANPFIKHSTILFICLFQCDFLYVVKYYKRIREEDTEEKNKAKYYLRL